MEILGIGIGFMGTVVVIAVMLAVTTSRWWHRRHHRDGRRLMCDHCMHPS